MYGYAYRYSARAGKLSFNPANLANTYFYSDPTIQSSVNSNLCQSLDGVTDALNADTLVGDLATTTTGILAGWIKPTNLTGTQTYISFGAGALTDWILIRMTASGKVSINFVEGGVTQFDVITDAVVLTSGVWSHIAIYQDGVTPTIYINNVAVAQTTTGASPTKWFNNLTAINNSRMGCQNITGSNASFSNTNIDEWGFWSNSTAVTAASLYNSGAGKTLTDLTTAEQVGLVGYYTLNDYLDTSGNSNTLTAIGTPTDAIGKVQTEVIAGEPVYRLGDLAPTLNDGTQPVLINEPIWNTTHITYATNDFINIDDVLTDIATSTQGTIAFWIKPVDATPLAAEIVISFGDTSAVNSIRGQYNTAGILIFICQQAGATVWTASTDAAPFTSGVWSHVILEFDVNAKVYVDNVFVAQTLSGADTTVFFSDLPLLDNGRIGCNNSNATGNTSFTNADIQQVYISTDVKDAATRTKLYNNNQPI